MFRKEMREPLWSIGCDAQRLTSVAADDELRTIPPYADLAYTSGKPNWGITKQQRQAPRTQSDSFLFGGDQGTP
jgi:hypothetical protein